MPDIDDAIQKAMREGKFDGLPGKGKPLNLDENPHEDPTWRTAYRMLRNSGFSLPWIELRNEIEAEIENACKTLGLAWTWRQEALGRNQPYAEVEAAWQRSLVAFSGQVSKINKKIFDYNLQTPSSQFQRSRLDADQEVERIRQAR